MTNPSHVSSLRGKQTHILQTTHLEPVTQIPALAQAANTGFCAIRAVVRQKTMLKWVDACS